MDVDMWISTSPGNKGSTVSNCGPKRVGLVGNIRWTQPTGLAAYEEEGGSNSDRKCILADDAIYYLNIEPNPACVASSLGSCHIAANLDSN